MTMANGSGLSYVYVGAARWAGGKLGGLFRQAVGDTHWEPLTKGLPEATAVQAITVHPGHSEVVYLGTQDGPYRSLDHGASWERLGFPDAGKEVWAIHVHPRNPKLLYAGTSPVGVYRSDDGGDTWRRLANVRQPERVKMAFACRVMRLAADPSHPDEVYAALEVGGAMRSLDAGETWTDCSAELLSLAELPHLKSKIGSDTDTEGMLDAHALCVSAAQPGTVFLAVRMGLFRSADRGTSWRDMEIGRFSPLTYGRDVRVSRHDPRTLYACLSPASRSQDGSLYRSQDLGHTWARFDHGTAPHSTMMGVALHDRDANQVYCATRHGQVFGTQDGGRTWRESRLPEGVQDVYAIACG
jgi:photosystem II stability/assembly factor-like uncharacterized protein